MNGFVVILFAKFLAVIIKSVTTIADKVVNNLISKPISINTITLYTILISYYTTVKPRFTGVVGGKEITPVNRGSR